MMSGTRMNSNLSDNPKTNKATITGSPMSARTFKSTANMTSKVTPRVAGGAWSMTPLMEVLPGSSPPAGSSDSSPLSSKTCSPKSEKNHFFPDLPSNASTPRLNQDELENAKDYGRLCLTNFQANPHKGSCLSKLSMTNTTFSAHHEIVGHQSNSEREERSVDEEDSHLAQGEQSTNEDSDVESPIAGRDKLMDRSKPYHEFLDEVKKQELQAEVEAWKKAEQLKLMTKLRREEAAIDEWEFKQTSKALKDIKKLEIKLEKQRAKAVENTWKTINMTKEEAKRKKVRARQCTIGRLSSVSENYQKTNPTKSLVWNKLTVYCKSMYVKSVRGLAPTSSERQRSLK
ncbi:remorin 4.2-like [Argentina anserina]|uniref:remorin 4.2-like n=1 Tax=Argentina anserina TaxID=57926 RepID=UPI0021764B68|nr:remorin 4.2-like [Potentilla anserina]